MNSGPTLALGANGPDVVRLQCILVMIKGYDWKAIDGIFGPATQQAVEEFQQGNGLTVDGIVGPATWQKLPADPQTVELAAGATGSVVSALQQGLQRYGGPGAPTDPGAIDGIFGPQTGAAVRAYQAQRVVSEGVGAVDGIVGDLTWWAPAGAAGATLAWLAGLTTN